MTARGVISIRASVMKLGKLLKSVPIFINYRRPSVTARPSLSLDFDTRMGCLGRSDSTKSPRLGNLV
jgi:hypothetical protein